MPLAMSRTLEICEPMEVQQAQAILEAASQLLPQVEHLAQVEAELGLVAAAVLHLPAPSEARRMRTPRPGFTPSARASSITSGSPEGFSTTM
jgi:hypothetical protein